jgi:hypothetical protein
MQVEVHERNGVPIVECAADLGAGDALDLIVACLENHSSRLLLEAHRLPEAFFDLRTGFAGELVQKLQNYQLRTGAVFPSEEGYGERFREFLSEARRGGSFRVFATRAEAEAWLASE